MVDVVLRVPLHLKIVVASVVCSGLAFTVGWFGSAAAHRMLPSGDSFFIPGLLGAAAVLVAILVSGAIVRVALIPLSQLEQAAKRVEQGDEEARAPLSRLADRDMTRLARAFNGALDRQAQYRGRLKDLALRGIRAQESSSRRVAIELREGPGQRLASLLLQLRAARPNGGGDTLVDLVEEARREITAVLDILGRQAGDRAERLLEDLGVAGAVEWRIRHTTRDRGVRVAVAVEPVDSLLSRTSRRALFQAVQEALDNVIRHADAREVRVSIQRERGRVVLEVVDDGRGFDLPLEGTRGLGLLELEERIAALGGRIDITSAPSRGTRLRVDIPARIEESAVARARPKLEHGP